MLHVIAGLSTGHKVGLGVVGAAFVAFALSASFLAPRRWPDFPGRHGLSVFVIACFVVFAGMLAAVYFFGKETKEAEAKAPAAAQSPGSSAGQTIKVTESEFKIQLPALGGLKPGAYTLQVHNAGKIPHDVVVTGPGTSATDKTPTIAAGKDATLKVTLAAGKYTLYCSIPGHRQLGMQAELSVG